MWWDFFRERGWDPKNYTKEDCEERLRDLEQRKFLAAMQKRFECRGIADYSAFLDKSLRNIQS